MKPYFIHATSWFRLSAFILCCLSLALSAEEKPRDSSNCAPSLISLHRSLQVVRPTSPKKARPYFETHEVLAQNESLNIELRYYPRSGLIVLGRPQEFAKAQALTQSRAYWQRKYEADPGPQVLRLRDPLPQSLGRPKARIHTWPSKGTFLFLMVPGTEPQSSGEVLVYKLSDPRDSIQNQIQYVYSIQLKTGAPDNEFLNITHHTTYDLQAGPLQGTWAIALNSGTVPEDASHKTLKNRIIFFDPKNGKRVWELNIGSLAQLKMSRSPILLLDNVSQPSTPAHLVAMGESSIRGIRFTPKGRFMIVRLLTSTSFGMMFMVDLKSKSIKAIGGYQVASSYGKFTIEGGNSTEEEALYQQASKLENRSGEKSRRSSKARPQRRK